MPEQETIEPGIVFTGVTKRFVSPTGAVMTAARDINMEIAPGEFCAIVGPTGCGKSTTLTMAAGLSEPSEGAVSVFGRPVNGVTPDAGFVFQADALMPWKSVLDNVALGPKFRGEPKAHSVDKARNWLKTVGLEGFENHYPHQLSGGMRKRAALAAALINEPKKNWSIQPKREPISQAPSKTTRTTAWVTCTRMRLCRTRARARSERAERSPAAAGAPFAVVALMLPLPSPTSCGRKRARPLRAAPPKSAGIARGSAG